MLPQTARQKPALMRLASLIRNNRGTVAVITAAVITTIAICMGLAIDLTRAYAARAKLSAALDAAGLAIGVNPPNPSDKNFAAEVAQANNTAESFINANLGPGSNITSNLSVNNTSLTLSAHTNIPTSFMGVVGISTLQIGSQSTISLAQNQGVEVALVLDNTGSLSYVDPSTGQSNITALKTAAGQLVLSLFGTTTINNPTMRVGIVPYVAAVNPGTAVASTMLKNPPTAITYNSSTGAENDPKDWTGCVVERTSTFATLTAAAVAADLDTPVSAAANNYLTQYIWPQTGHATSLNWSPTPAPYGNINAGPFSNGVTSPGPNQSCPSPVVPLTNSITNLVSSIGFNVTTKTAINNSGMEDWQNGGTIGSIGMSWGYRLLSPNGPYATTGAETVSNWNSGWLKVVVLMTDGVNNINSNSGIKDYNGAPAGSNPSVSLVDQQEELVCDALRSKGVVIYSVFLNSNSTPGPALAYCAGTTAGKGDTNYYYVAQNQAALYSAFSAIASSVVKLHVSK